MTDQIDAHALLAQAKAARDQGRLDEAISDQTRAVDGLRSSGSDGLAQATRHLADMLQQAGRHDDADPLYAETLTLYAARPDTPPLELANALRSVALHREHMGDLRGAEVAWRDVRERYAALEEVFHRDYGLSDNPGVAEGARQLARLAGRRAEL